jgi:hypothetical protein
VSILLLYTSHSVSSPLQECSLLCRAADDFCDIPSAGHMKGVTPSTPDLINTLDSETKDQAKLDSYPDEEYDDEEDFEDEGGSLPLDEAAMLSPGGANASYVGGDHVAHGSEANGGLADLTEETGSAVSDTAGG